MGTRSQIGILKPDETVLSSYCHWDGYPGHVGRLLYNFYNTREKVLELLSYGSISSLGEEIGEKHPFDNPYPLPLTNVGQEIPDDVWNNSDYVKHRDKYKKMCKFYHRDRGDVLANNHWNSEKEYLNCYEKTWASYIYLFKNNAWYIKPSGPFNGRNSPSRLVLLTESRINKG